MNVGYARVSTSSQSLENQIEQLKVAGCEKIFSEKRSGKNASDREQFKIMKNFIREGDVLFVTKLDRLARSVIDLHEFAKYLENKDVNLKVLNQNIDTTSPAGRLLFTMLGAIAEFERDLINKRVREGIEAAKAKGVKFGRKAILSYKQKKEELKLREQRRINKKNEWLQHVSCPYCDGNNLNKKDRKITKNNLLTRYFCKDCNRQFQNSELLTKNELDMILLEKEERTKKEKMFENIFCPSCNSNNLTNKGIRIGKTKAVRKIRCKDCKKEFSINVIESDT